MPASSAIPPAAPSGSTGVPVIAIGPPDEDELTGGGVTEVPDEEWVGGPVVGGGPVVVGGPVVGGGVVLGGAVVVGGADVLGAVITMT